MSARAAAIMAGGILAAAVLTAAPQSYRGILVPINPEINRIEDASGALNVFFDRLRDLTAARKGQVAILHIGDSHVDAGYFPGAVRAGLQAEFGDAGRGVVKPALTGLYPKKRISSLAVRQDIKSARIQIGLKDPDPAQGFNGLLLYHEKGFEYYDYEVRDPDGRVLATVKCGRPKDWPGMGGVQISNVELPGLYRRVVLRPVKDSQRSGQRYAQLYGASLENGESGVIYHAYGIIGGTCLSYLRSPYFLKLLERIQPELVIVSLGTNDASTPLFRKEPFAQALDALLTQIKIVSPSSALLLTTAPDSYYPRPRWRTAKPNPHMAGVREVILEAAAKRSCATWDLFSIMGGSTSMKLWVDSALANSDYIHFTKEGYERQGRLLLDALMNGYRTHAQARPR